MIKIYKDSKNEIPNAWNKIALYELRNKKDRYAFTGGPFGSDLKSEHYTQEGIKILQLQNIGEGRFINKGITYTSEEKANELISCNIYPNEIILAKMAPVARCCKVPVTDERYVMCSDGIRLSVDTEKFNNEFVFQALNSRYFRDEAESKSTGTTRARIGLNELKLIPILIPDSLSEQQKIAEILSTVDEKIEIIDQQINQTQELKKGLMQRLLTKGIGHTEFKDSPLGMIPESWEVTKTDEIANITSSKRIYLSDYTDNGIPFFRGKEITQLSKGENINDLVYIKENTFLELKNKFGAPEEGDILITAVGTIGSIYMVNSEDNFYFKDGNLMWLRKIEDKLDKKFFAHYLRSNIFQSLIDVISSGSSQKALTIVKFKTLPIVIPPKEEQIKIAEILDGIYEKVSVLEEKKVNYQELKQGLMQQLLTGKIRVKV